MKEIFSNQKIHDILEAVNDSLDMHTWPEAFYAIYDGKVYQNGNIDEILGRLFRTFPDKFTNLVIEDITDKLEQRQSEGASTDIKDILDDTSNGLSNDPTQDEYWGDLGKSELDIFKENASAQDRVCLSTMQDAIRICNEQDLIDGDGNIIGRDLRRVLQRNLGLDEIVNFQELDGYLENCCNQLLSKELVTIGKHPSNGRTRTYNFLNSPFKLY